MNNSTVSLDFNRSQPVPAAYVVKGPAQVKYSTKIKHGYFRLPFVGNWRAKGVEAPNWNVPAAGGYFGGYQTGEAMAHAFLKYLRDGVEGELSAHHLTSIIESFMIRFEQEGGQDVARHRNRDRRSDSFNSFRGQYIGFINTVSMWLMASARRLGGDLDAMGEADLARRANEGLRFNERAYMAEVARMDR